MFASFYYQGQLFFCTYLIVKLFFYSFKDRKVFEQGFDCLELFNVVWDEPVFIFVHMLYCIESFNKMLILFSTLTCHFNF